MVNIGLPCKKPVNILILVLYRHFILFPVNSPSFAQTELTAHRTSRRFDWLERVFSRKPSGRCVPSRKVSMREPSDPKLDLRGRTRELLARLRPAVPFTSGLLAA